MRKLKSLLSLALVIVVVSCNFVNQANALGFIYPKMTGSPQFLMMDRLAPVLTPIKITAGNPALITATGDIRITIPSTINAVWDEVIIPRVYGNAANKIGSDPIYLDSRTMYIDVVTDFVVGDYITIDGLDGLRFLPFATSAPAPLEFSVNGGVHYFTGDVTTNVSIAPYSPYPLLTTNYFSPVRLPGSTRTKVLSFNISTETGDINFNYLNGNQLVTRFKVKDIASNFSPLTSSTPLYCILTDGVTDYSSVYTYNDLAVFLFEDNDLTVSIGAPVSLDVVCDTTGLTQSASMDGLYAYLEGDNIDTVNWGNSSNINVTDVLGNAYGDVWGYLLRF